MRAGLVQLLCVLAGLGLGLLLPRIITVPSVASTRVTEALVAIGFGTLGLVSIIGIAAWRPWTSGRGGNAAPPFGVSR